MNRATLATISMAGALWEGDSKWDVNAEGHLSPCSLKRLCLSYISENLGSVSTIRPHDAMTTISYKDNCSRFKCGAFVNERTETSCVGVGKKAYDKKYLSVYTRGSNTTSCSEISSGQQSINTSVNSDSSSYSNINGKAPTSPNSMQNVIPSTVFNVPNNGKVYDKSDSIDPPGDDKERNQIFKKHLLSFVFRKSGVYLSPVTTGQLFQELDRCGMINDSTVSLFNSTRMPLHEVIIRRCGPNLTVKGLFFLEQHNLIRLEVHNFQLFSDCIALRLNPWTRNNLVALSLRGYNPPAKLVADPHKFYKVLTETPNLQELDLSHNSCLLPHTLETIFLQLPRLWKLNISHCRRVTTIEPLSIIKERLLHLSLAGVMIRSTSITITVLKKLDNLRYLDVSTLASILEASGDEECINEVLVDPNFAPALEYVDVSNQLEVSRAVLARFLESHPFVRCVGLINVPQCADFNIDKYPHVQFLRDVSCDNKKLAVDRINDCLQHYRLWPHILSKILTYTTAVVSSEPQPLLVANILRCLESNQLWAHIQVSGTACLYNLTVGALGPALHPSLLRSVVHVTIHAMTCHMDDHQLQKNGLLLLCCDSVLHHVSFNQYWVAMMALHALHNYADDSVDLMAVGICSILAAKLSNEQTAQLGSNPEFMFKLLALVRRRITDTNVDITLQFTLSALWNLTDESPVTCRIFLDQDGLQLFINLLLTFPDNTAVETKVLGLFNNVAEVPWLRSELLKPPFIAMLRRQLHSEHIAVSYFAAGISAHLICAEQQAWEDADDLPYHGLLYELGNAVLGWKAPKEEMVAYKSFQPFLPLLHAGSTPHVQLWAMWALHHVTVNNSEYYCPMLIREGIPKLLESIHDEALISAPYVSRMAGSLLDLVSGYKNGQSKSGQPMITQSSTPDAKED